MKPWEETWEAGPELMGEACRDWHVRRLGIEDTYDSGLFVEGTKDLVRLAAAAPELYRALQAAVDACDECDGRAPDAWRAALKKARGER